MLKRFPSLLLYCTGKAVNYNDAFCKEVVNYTLKHEEYHEKFATSHC